MLLDRSSIEQGNVSRLYESTVVRLATEIRLTLVLPGVAALLFVKLNPNPLRCSIIQRSDELHSSLDAVKLFVGEDNACSGFKLSHKAFKHI